MATHDTVSVSKRSWTKLNTGGAITGACTFAPIAGTVWLAVVATDTAPTGDPRGVDGAFPVGSAPMAFVNQTLAEIWPGATSPAYVFAYAELDDCLVAVSCA